MDDDERAWVSKKVGKAEASATKERYTEEAKAILSFLNEKTGKAFRPSPTNLAFITARLSDGITAEQLRAIVVRKAREWQGSDMAYCLRPATLFNRTKCEQYIGDIGS